MLKPNMSSEIHVKEKSLDFFFFFWFFFDHGTFSVVQYSTSLSMVKSELMAYIYDYAHDVLNTKYYIPNQRICYFIAQLNYDLISKIK